MGSVIAGTWSGPGCHFPELRTLGGGVRGHLSSVADAHPPTGSLFAVDPTGLHCSEFELRGHGEEQHRTYAVVDSFRRFL